MMAAVTSIVGLCSAFVLLLMSTCFVAGQTKPPSLSAAIEEKLKDYDKRLPPNFRKNDPVEVTVSMYVMDISSVDENTMDFTLTCYFRQSWKDTRLAGIELEGWDRSIIHNMDIVDRIWTPDTFFVKDKETIFHETSHPNSLLKISPEGEILRSIRITSKIACSMDLSNFPMDTQKCSFYVESYGLKASEVKYSWRGGGGAGVFGPLELLRFRLVGYRTYDESVQLSTGNYSRLGLDFFFKRDMGYYVINLYLPAIFIVLLSCLSFWLSPHCTYARGALTISCFLALIVLMTANDDALPPVSYVRAIDVYFFTCFLFVIFALVQFVGIYNMRPRNIHQYEELEKGNNQNEDQHQVSSFQLDASLLKILETRATKADKYAKHILPVVFVLFNFFYWIIYLNIGGIKGEYTKYDN